MPNILQDVIASAESSTSNVVLNAFAVQKLNYCRENNIPFYLGLKCSNETSDYLEVDELTPGDPPFIDPHCAGIRLNNTTTWYNAGFISGVISLENGDSLYQWYSRCAGYVPVNGYDPAPTRMLLVWDTGTLGSTPFTSAEVGIPFTYIPEGMTFHLVVFASDTPYAEDNQALWDGLGTTNTGNRAPTCQLVNHTVNGMMVTVTPTWSDPDGDAISDARMDWGNGAQTIWDTPAAIAAARNQPVSYTYAQAGTYVITGLVNDAQGATGVSDGLVVVIDAPPDPPDPPLPPICSFSVSMGQNGHSVTINATASYDPDGVITAWRFNPGDGSGWHAGTVGQAATYDYGDAQGQFLLTVEVTDDEALSAQQALLLSWSNRQRRVQSTPTSCRLLLHGAGPGVWNVPLRLTTATRLLILHQITGATTGAVIALESAADVTFPLGNEQQTASYSASAPVTADTLTLVCTVTDGTHSVWVREV